MKKRKQTKPHYIKVKKEYLKPLSILSNAVSGGKPKACLQDNTSKAEVK